MAKCKGAGSQVWYLRPCIRVRLLASRGGIGTMRAASAPFFRHSATATAIGAVAVFSCVT